MEYPTSLQVIFRRHSCRHFLADPVKEIHLRWILEAARWAPSAGNLQPWHFYVVRRPSLKVLLSQAAYGRTFVSQAPVVIVVCAIPQHSARIYGKRGETLCVL